MLPGAGPKRLLSAVRALFVDDLLEEVVTFVIDQDKRREIFYFDFPDSFHTQLRISDALQMLDALLRQYRRRTADATEVEAAVFMSRVGNLLTAVTFRQHDHAAAVGLQQIHVGVHTACGGWAK